MAKQPAVLASGITLDGGYRAIPGYTTGAQNGGQPPYVIQSGILDFFDGTTTAFWCAPFNYTVIAAGLYLTETLGTAASSIIIGISSDTDHFVESTVVPTTAAPVEVALTLTATVTGNKGDLIGFISGNGATATGKGYAWLIVAPRV